MDVDPAEEEASPVWRAYESPDGNDYTPVNLIKA
jgi:hypothetical protein